MRIVWKNHSQESANESCKRGKTGCYCLARRLSHPIPSSNQRQAKGCEILCLYPLGGSMDIGHDR